MNDDPAGGAPVRCRMRPYRIRRFRLGQADAEARARSATIMARECARFGATLAVDAGDLVLSGD